MTAIGFDLQHLQGNGTSASTSFGLRGIRERLEMLRGSLVVQSAPEQGTVLIAEVPRATEILDRETRNSL